MDKNKKIDFKIILDLALSYLKIGLFTFGGGLAMISLLEHEYVERRKWLEKDEFENVVAIAESTPGPVAINCATYIGYKMGGILGSIVATVAVCLPSFLIIYLISLFFNAFIQIELVAYAFKGIQVGVIFLILNAGIKFFKNMKKTAFNIVVFSCTLCCSLAFSLFGVDFSSIFFVLIGGASGFVVYLIGSLCKKGEKGEEQ
ncbi:MAG: chromate transporter [Clostridia bacterium]|nr:chromate transporter [Clostridia bacterium]